MEGVGYEEDHGLAVRPDAPPDWPGGPDRPGRHVPLGLSRWNRCPHVRWVSRRQAAQPTRNGRLGRYESRGITAIGLGRQRRDDRRPVLEREPAPVREGVGELFLVGDEQ